MARSFVDRPHAVLSCHRPGVLTIDVRRKYVLSDSLAALERFKVRAVVVACAGVSSLTVRVGVACVAG